MWKRLSLGWLMAVCGLTVLTGCDPLTRNRFDMIVVDQSTTDDVQRTLGGPTSRLAGAWHYERTDRHLDVIIDFNADGVVTRKQWIDANSNAWIDTQEQDTSDTFESTKIRTTR